MAGAGASDGGPIADAVRQAAREREPDRYLAALLAPRALQGDVAALAAFSGEVSRVGDIVSEPLIGEIRLQWWRDALRTVARGERTGHPVADALGHAVRRHGLPLDLLDTLIDAQSAWLEGAVSDAALQDSLIEAEAALFKLGLMVLGVPRTASSDAAAMASGSAYGLARTPRRRRPAVSPARPDAGHDPRADAAANPASMPPSEDVARTTRDRVLTGLASARRRAAALGPQARLAFLPLVMVEPYLRAQEHGDAARFSYVGSVTPLRRIWRLWWANRRGRF